MRKARNLANISIKMARADYIKEQLNTNKNDRKKFWKNIAEIIPNSKSTSLNFSNIHDDDDNSIISHENLASYVNCFFLDIGVKLDNTIPYIKNVTGPTLPHDADPLERFKPIEEIDLVTEINKISVYKSSGINNLPTYILNPFTAVSHPGGFGGGFKVTFSRCMQLLPCFMHLGVSYIKRKM